MKGISSSRKGKLDRIMVSLVAAVVVVVVLLLIFNAYPIKITGNVVNQADGSSQLNQASSSSPTNQSPQNIVIPNKVHIPVKLNSTDILVSFRIDDITFETKQKQVLENALFLARKYNITFDLAVIAKPFDERADPAVFKIYQDNQDVFEVVAHGWDHKEYQGITGNREFSRVPYEYQEEHIKKMKEVFERHNLYWGTKIFVVPWHAGDENTIFLSDKYGYNLIVQSIAPINSSKYQIEVMRSRIEINMTENLSSKSNSYKQRFNDASAKNKELHIVMHPINFYRIENSDELVNQLVNNDLYKSRIKFSFISDRFAN